jgi:uncharacterized protein YlxW (UPF0749 family)
MSDWVFDKYLSEIHTNRSKFVEEMIVQGIESITGGRDRDKSKMASLVQELRNRQEEIARLKLENAGLKNKLKSKNHLTDTERFAKSMILSRV